MCRHLNVHCKNLMSHFFIHNQIWYAKRNLHPLHHSITANIRPLSDVSTYAATMCETDHRRTCSVGQRYIHIAKAVSLVIKKEIPWTSGLLHVGKSDEYGWARLQHQFLVDWRLQAPTIYHKIASSGDIWKLPAVHEMSYLTHMPELPKPKYPS